MGLISPVGKMVNLIVNNEEKGHYYLIETLNKDFLKEKHSITQFAITRNVIDFERKEKYITGNNHTSFHDLYEGHLQISGKKKFRNEALIIHSRLRNIIQSNEVEKLNEIFDFNYMAKFLALQLLCNDVHFTTGDNLKFVFDSNSNKLYPLFRCEGPGLL